MPRRSHRVRELEYIPCGESGYKGRKRRRTQLQGNESQNNEFADNESEANESEDNELDDDEKEMEVKASQLLVSFKF